MYATNGKAIFDEAAIHRAAGELRSKAFAELLGINEFRLFDVDQGATAKLIANLAAHGMRVTAHANVAEAVRGADIITTITADKTRRLIDSTMPDGSSTLADYAHWVVDAAIAEFSERFART